MSKIASKKLEKVLVDNYIKIIENYKVSFVNKNYSYAFLKGMFNNGNILINLDGNSTNNIFESKTLNLCFRIWHDYIHFKHDYDFSLKGEYLTYKKHCEYLKDLPYEQRLLRIEIVYQAAYYLRNGKFVEDQIEFTKQFLVL